MAKFSKKNKIIVLAVLAVLMVAAGIFGVIHYNANKAYVGDVPSVRDGLVSGTGDPDDRPTEQADWFLDETAEESKGYPFEIGQGIVGEEKPGLETSGNYTPIYLPTTSQQGVWPGTTLKISGEGVKEDQNLKAWIFPYETSKEDDKAITVDITPDETTRDAVYNITVPTNLSEGAYTVRIQTYEEILFFDILVTEHGSIHVK